MNSKPLTYADTGVNIDEANRATEKYKDPVKATHNEYVVAGIGSFGGMLEIPPGYQRPVLVQSADGVGTKLKIAISMGKHDTVGECLVNHCVNDIAVQGAVPLTFLNYIAAGKLEAQVAVDVVKGMSKACVENSCAIIGGETAEMPGFYYERMYDVAGFMTGIVEHSKILGPHLVMEGDVLFGLPSTGLHTNGYSLARKVFFEQEGYTVETSLPAIGCSVGEELLKVHRSYLHVIRTLISKDALHAAAHITGGGLTENVPRMLPSVCKAVIRKGRWKILPIFELLRKLANQPEDDYYRTFNLGIGMVLAVPYDKRHEVCAVLDEMGEPYFVIGSVLLRNAGEPPLVYKTYNI